MNKNLAPILMSAVLLFLLLPVVSNEVPAAQASPGKGRIVFVWVNQTTKSFWVNNTYISCYFEGQQGASLIELRHREVPGVDFVDDVKMAATGPDIGWTSSRWGIDLSNVTVSFKRVTDSFAILNVTTLNNNIKFEIIYYFTDSDVILVEYRATLLSDITLTSIGAEFVPATIATKGAKVFYVDYYGDLKSQELNGSMLYIPFGNSTEGTLPLAENWIAVYNPTQGLSAGIIWIDPSMFMGKRSTVGVWDGAVWSVASLVSRWYDNPAGKKFPKGTVFVNYILIWAGPGDYNRLRSLSELVKNVKKYYGKVITSIRAEFEEYKSTHTHTDEEYNTLLSRYEKLMSDYQALKSEYESYKSTYTVTQAQLQQARTNSTIMGTVVGLVIGVAVGWFIKREKSK